jgi:hypothetical protein
MFSANSSQVSDDKLFVEDVFSTYLYTGNGGTQTITNGIDLAGKGGLVWLKERSANYPDGHWLFDTSRGTQNLIKTNTTGAQQTIGSTVDAFNSTGFSIGPIASFASLTYASWTFREAPKFFDVVTYTGNGTSQTISHNLGVTPGCIIVKRTDGAANWAVWHRGFSNPATGYAWLNLTDAASTSASVWNNTAPTSTGFSVGGATATNGPGYTYVAYLYAHDTASDGIIQCGSYTGNGSATGPVVTLGWEPQWILVKDATATDGFGSWLMFDNMRGWPVGSNGQQLFANSTSAEGGADRFVPTATGFNVTNGYSQSNVNGNTYIYMAIRRGPMRTPTLGTSVFKPDFLWNTSTSIQRYAGFPSDFNILGYRGGNSSNAQFSARLVGTNAMYSSQTVAEVNDGITWDSNLGSVIVNGTVNTNFISYSFRRAPSFFDTVCYTGTGAAITIPHNLGVVPELIIQKRRNGANNWYVFAAQNGFGTLNATSAWGGLGNGSGTNTIWQATASSVALNSTFAPSFAASGSTNVAYLFASCPGVSKVGSYTGNGSSQTIDCGFAAGARFVMIKRTNATGDWYVWDTARGIVSGNDPHLSLNTTAAEVTTDDTIDTDSSGFVVNQVAATNVNVNAATYIYLAIA